MPTDTLALIWVLSGSWKYLDLSALCGQIVGVYLFVVQSDLMRPIAAWSVLLSFVKLLSFARGFASSGPLIRMIAKIIVDVSTGQQCFRIIRMAVYKHTPYLEVPGSIYKIRKGQNFNSKCVRGSIKVASTFILTGTVLLPYLRISTCRVCRGLQRGPSCAQSVSLAILPHQRGPLRLFGCHCKRFD